MKISARKVLLATGAIAAVAVPSGAMAAGEGNPLKGGARSPSSDPRQNYTKETEVIANVPTYGTRQSNKSATGGGAIYGCRSGAGGTPTKNSPCIRSVNLNLGYAFEFQTGGVLGGTITVGKGGDGVKPFTTNATGVATGLNADRVDGRSGDELLGKTEKAADADKLDGNDSADFAKAGDLLFARVAADGTTVNASRPSGATSTAPDADTARVTFSKNVSACSFTASEAGTDAPTGGDISVGSAGGAAVDVTFSGPRSAFHLQVIC
jgi:hypothetical protein